MIRPLDKRRVVFVATTVAWRDAVMAHLEQKGMRARVCLDIAFLTRIIIFLATIFEYRVRCRDDLDKIWGDAVDGNCA